MNLNLASTLTSLALIALCNCTPSVLAAPSAKSFGQLPGIYDAAIAPDGKHLAVVINIKGSYGVLTRTTKKSAKKPMFHSLGDTVKPRFVKWVNNKRYVVSIARSEDYRGTPLTTTHLIAIDIETKTSNILVRPKDVFRQFNDRVVDWLEDDPEHILMAYSDESFQAYPDLRKVNVETGRDRVVKGRIKGIQGWMTDNKGIARVGQGSMENGTKKIRILNPETKKWVDSKPYPGLRADTIIHSILKEGREIKKRTLT